MIWPLFVVILVIFSSCTGCPSECSCKWKSGKKTVECSDRGLISIPIGIDKETQVLDISGNDLQSLNRETFQRSGLMDLQKMYTRSCRLGQIDRYAFRGLSNLIEIDLSDNLLTRVPSQAFEDIPYLRNISLAGNPIQRVEPFSFVSVRSLVRLDLSRCDIASVRSKAFDGLANLEYLKLNGNELRNLHVDTLENLSKLKSVELDGNRWHCDCRLRAVKTWIDERKVDIPTPILCSGGPERIEDKSLAELDSVDFACRPSIKTDPRYAEAVIGGNVTVECEVESDPVATISWYFGGSRVLPNNGVFDGGPQRVVIFDSAEDDVRETRSKLVMRILAEVNAGEYRCVAENRAGNDEANFTLYVLPPPASGIVPLSSANVDTIAIVALGALLLLVPIVILLLAKKIRPSSYGSSEEKSQNVKPAPENNSTETSSQKSYDSEMKSEFGKAFTVASDLSYSRSFSDIAGNPALSNPDLISGTNNVRDSTRITPLPTTRPISDHCRNWQTSYAMPAAASSSAFDYDIYDRTPIVVDTVSAGSGSDDVFTHSRTSNDYPPDYGLPILPANGISQPCAETLKVRQRGSGPPPVPPPVPPPAPPPALQTMPPHSRNSPADRRYRRCGTDV